MRQRERVKARKASDRGDVVRVKANHPHNIYTNEKWPSRQMVGAILLFLNGRVCRTAYGGLFAWNLYASPCVTPYVISCGIQSAYVCGGHLRSVSSESEEFGLDESCSGS